MMLSMAINNRLRSGEGLLAYEMLAYSILEHFWVL